MVYHDIVYFSNYVNNTIIECVMCDSWVYLLHFVCVVSRGTLQTKDFKALRFTWLNCMHDVMLQKTTEWGIGCYLVGQDT